MDVKHLARSLGILQQPAISRASELIRLLKIKVPGGLGQGEICRPAVCLELACQTTPGSKLPTRDEFIRHSCSAPKVYNETFTKIQRLLDVRPALELRELVTLFGCSQLHDNVQQLLRCYKARFLEALVPADRARADLTRPVFLAATFLLVAKKHKASVDRAALTAKMGLTRAELTGAMEDVAALCADQLAPAGAKGRNKREREEGTDAGPFEVTGAEPEGVNVAEGTSGGGGGEEPGQAKPRAKRSKRAAVRREANEEEEDDGGRVILNPADVAVEDLKLVLIGMGGAADAAGDAPGDSSMTSGRRARLKTSRKRVAAAAAKKECQEGGEGEEHGEKVDGEGGAAAVAKARRRRVVRARHAGMGDEDGEE